MRGGEPSQPPSSPCNMNRFFLLSISLLLFFSLLPLQTMAAEKEEEKELIIISDMGDTHNLPENSLSALKKAAETADFLHIPLQKTADGYLILSKDPNLKRVCQTDAVPISEMKLDEIQKLSLFTAKGGKMEKTDERPLTLTEAFAAIEKPFLLDFDWEIRDDVYRAAAESGRLSDSVFVCRDGAKKALAWRDSQEKSPGIMVYQKTNIVFTALSAAKALQGQPNAYLWLATSNPYGVIFSELVTEAGGKTAGLCLCLTDENLCGKRADTDNYREDAAARGYNMLMTADSKGLSAYREESVQARQSLDLLLKEEKNRDLPEFKGRNAKDFRFAYTNALQEAEKLSQKGFAGMRECQDAEEALRRAAKAIDENYDLLSQGKAGATITPARITICVLAVIGFIAAEGFFYQHRKSD